MLFVSLGTSYQGRVEIRGRQKQISRPPSTAAMVSYLASDKGGPRNYALSQRTVAMRSRTF